MRSLLTLSTTMLAAGLAVGCGSSVTSPPSTELPSELAVNVTVSPDARGGLRSSSTVSSVVFDPAAGRGTLKSAEYTVHDAQGNVLAHETITGPLPFAGSASVTIQRTLVWTPAEVLGRSLRIHYVIDATNNTVYDFNRTFEF